jgi:hypothetical protein
MCSAIAASHSSQQQTHVKENNCMWAPTSTRVGVRKAPISRTSHTSHTSHPSHSIGCSSDDGPLYGRRRKKLGCDASATRRARITPEMLPRRGRRLRGKLRRSAGRPRISMNIRLRVHASQNGRPSHVPGLDIMSVYQEIRWSVTGRHYVVSTSSLSAARSWLDTLSIVSFSWAIFSARFCLRVTSHPVSRSVSQSVGQSAGQSVSGC